MISIAACCHSVKLCALAAWDFRSQRYHPCHLTNPPIGFAKWKNSNTSASDSKTNIATLNFGNSKKLCLFCLRGKIKYIVLFGRIRTGSYRWFSKILRIRTESDSISSDQDRTRTEKFPSPLISVRRSEKRKDRIGKARRDAGNVFSIYSVFLPKFQYGKCTNMDSYQKFQTQRYVFVILIRFLAVSWIQECFHWLSSSIHSGVMADQRFPVSSEISDLCEISDLLLFFSYFASQNEVWQLLFWCVLFELRHFG